MSLKTDAQLKTDLDTNIDTNGANEITGAILNAYETDVLNSKVSLIDIQTIHGLKTFDVFPLTPSYSPSSDYEVANKKYVDYEITASNLWTEDTDSVPPFVAMKTARELHMQTKLIKGVVDPVELQDAATKAYVDNNSSGKLFSQSSIVTVEDSTLSSTTIGSGVGTLTIPASSLSIGDVIKINQYGVITNESAGAENLTMVVKAGSLVTLANKTKSIPTGYSDAIYELESQFTVVSTGLTGSLLFTGSMQINDASKDSWSIIPLTSTTQIAIDTTIDQTIDIMAQWATASISLSISSLNTVIEKL